MGERVIFTVGHSNMGAAEFVALVQRHAIGAVADVRSHPYSRYLPHFNGPALKATLRGAGIGYVFLGRELGARPDDPACYEGGRVSFARLAATPLFAEGLARLHKGMAIWRIAIMCAEKDPLTCHRTILVCRHLRAPDLAIGHILPGGELEAHRASEQRLVRQHGLGQTSFLAPSSPADLLEAAYDRQAARIAYSRDEGGDDERAVVEG